MRPMTRCSSWCAWLCCAAGLAFPAGGQEPAAPAPLTLAQRLIEQHIRVATDQETRTYSITVYTAQQQQRNLEAMARFKAEQEQHHAAVAVVDTKLRNAYNTRAGNEVVKAIIAEREALMADHYKKRQAYGPYLTAPDYYFVRSVGEDYLELQSETRAKHVRLLPLRFVRDVWITPPDDAANDQTAPRDEDEPSPPLPTTPDAAQAQRTTP